MQRFQITRWVLVVALAPLVACGTKAGQNAGDAGGTSTAGSSTAGETTAGGSTAGGSTAGGIIQPGRSEGVGSQDPHPANCNAACSGVVAANDNDTTRQYNCTTPIGQSVPCEGFCFVAESVTPRWNTEPPTSGPLYPRYDYEWGEHTTPLARGYWVHNLAHGFIVIAYNCPNGCAADLDAIRDVMKVAAGARVILTPDPLLTGSSFAALAWTWSYTFDHADPAALTCFIAQHNKNGWPH